MKSLPVRWRPSKFEEVIGQDQVVDILKRQLSLNKLSHAYLFTGPSGCGKTTIARILANEINNGIGNPIEIDAASNSGVDNVREIIKTACERSIDSEYKIFIIDEAHGLSNQAWQAFLKCIEEPPEYTIFIFCTTEKNKVPATIKNRCMTLNFGRVPSKLIYDRLEYISTVEGFENYRETCKYISMNCDGQVRLALSMLEMCSMQGNDICMNNVRALFSDLTFDDCYMIINAIIDGDEARVLDKTESIYFSGLDMSMFIKALLNFVLNVYMYIIFGDICATNFSEDYGEKLNVLTNFNDAKSYYNYYLDSLVKLENFLKSSDDKKGTVEINLLKMTRLQEV